MKYIDEEEKEIIESLRDLDVDSLKSDTQNINKLQRVAKEYMEKQDRLISLRISSRELERLKKLAAKKGMRYQTLVKTLIHQALEEEAV